MLLAEGLPLPEPGLVAPPVRMVRMAWAPKLMRRAKGVVGAVRVLGAASSSSMAFSSMESELVEMLPRRMPAETGMVVGEVPERPSVEMERRRRWSFMAAVVMGPGKTLVPCEVELLLWKRLVKAAEVTEARRARGMSACGGESFWVSLLDIVTKRVPLLDDGEGLLL